MSAAVSGCLAVPKLAAPTARVEPTSLSAERSFAGAAAQWPADRWWERYGDPQLVSLIDEALRDSPTVAEAEGRVRQAQSLADRARADELPEVSANATSALTKQSYNNGPPPQFVPHGYKVSSRVTLDFSYDFDFWGRNRAALAAASSEAAAASADAAAARMILAASIADAYGELSRLYAERDIAFDALNLRQRSAGLVAQRQETGLDTLQARHQAAAQVPAARETVASLDEQIGLTRNRLAALAGAGPDRGRGIARPAAIMVPPFGLPQKLAANLIGRRPDIVAARRRADAATARVRVARAGFYPNVNLLAFIGFQALGLGNLLKSGSEIGSTGPAVSLPIFDAGRIRASYRGARAQADVAVDAYNGAIVEALHQVADAATSERSIAERLSEGRQSLLENEAAYALAKLRYEGQLSDYLTVLEAQDRVLASRRTVADLDARSFTLDVALVRALGGGFSDGREPTDGKRS